MLSKIRHSKLIGMIPLLLWVMMLWNGFQNRHTHIGINGEFITHAHPFQDGNDDHQHTEEELIFWDLISNPIFEIGSQVVHIPEQTAIEFYQPKATYNNPHTASLFLGPDDLRGPPATI
jgi:hypothetical protein